MATLIDSIASIIPNAMKIIPEIPGRPNPGDIASITNSMSPIINTIKDVHSELPAIMFPAKNSPKDIMLIIPPIQKPGMNISNIIPINPTVSSKILMEFLEINSTNPDCPSIYPCWP